MLGGGLLSLLFRQTNIFWVAIFLGGLEVVRVIKETQPKEQMFEEESTWSAVIQGAWTGGQLYDPLVSGSVCAPFEGIWPFVSLQKLAKQCRLFENECLFGCSYGPRSKESTWELDTLPCNPRHLWYFCSIEWRRCLGYGSSHVILQSQAGN